MSEPEPIGCDYTREPVCPFCAHEVRDAWELKGDDGDEIEHTCGQCEQEFKCCRNVRVTWTSWKPEEKRP